MLQTLARINSVLLFLCLVIVNLKHPPEGIDLSVTV